MVALAPGVLKLTVALLPTLKVFQLMTALLELWLMFITAPGAVLITALPATTWPPVGNALAAGACADAGNVKSSDRPNANHVYVWVSTGTPTQALFRVLRLLARGLQDIVSLLGNATNRRALAARSKHCALISGIRKVLRNKCTAK